MLMAMAITVSPLMDDDETTAAESDFWSGVGGVNVVVE